MSQSDPPRPWPAELPLLPLRDAVVFPSAVEMVVIGQERSRKLIADVGKADPLVVVVAQRSEQAAAAHRAVEKHHLGKVALHIP